MMVVVELHAVQVELAAAAGNFPLHGRAKIVDVELCDLLRILSGLDVDVPELHGHARLLCPRRAEATRAAAAWQHEQRNSTAIRQIASVFREQDRAFDRIQQRQIAVAARRLRSSD